MIPTESAAGGGLPKAAVVGLALLSFSLLGGLALAGLAPDHFKVSQRGRAFLPGELIIERGDVVEIVNDDGDLLHHAYVESDKFNFDSGDQEPGSKIDVAFTASGNFTVLCGIHPKMKLLVHVNSAGLWVRRSPCRRARHASRNRMPAIGRASRRNRPAQARGRARG
jgi:plastocyanin